MAHFGRGGAGNKLGADIQQSPSLPPSTTPILTSKNYTTGRGGQGNIVSNDSAETARLAQDVDVPGIALPEGDVHTGRGGGGNIYKLSATELEKNKEHNSHIRSTSFTKERSGLKGLADKARDVLKPNDPKH